MNAGLAALYHEDRADHVSQAPVGTPEYRAMRERDRARRERVMALVATDTLDAPEDFCHAAWIMNHGDHAQDARHAHRLALRASELGHRPARWLAAASYDRWLMYQGKPQKYGTNYIFDGRRHRLWDVDPATTDEERAAWDVPPLAEQRRKAEEANAHQTPMAEEDITAYRAAAPVWLQAALEAEGKEGNNDPRRN